MDIQILANGSLYIIRLYLINEKTKTKKEISRLKKESIFNFYKNCYS